MEKAEFRDGAITLYCGDMFDILPTLDIEADAVISDPPFGITACEWDVVPPLDSLWEMLDNKTKPQANFVMFAAGGFTVDLINSKRNWYRYDLIWAKNNRVGFLNSNLMPLRAHESILVFGRPGFREAATYNPVKLQGGRPFTKTIKNRKAGIYPANDKAHTASSDGGINPCSILAFSNDREGNQPEKCYHPTMKPLSLVGFLLMLYTQPGDLVLDMFMGSGTTAIACTKLNRRFIGCEKNPDYFQKSVRRIEESMWQKKAG